MKENILFIVLVFIGIGAGYFTGVYVGKKQTEARYQSAPTHRDTATTIQHIPKPEQSQQVKPKPKMTAQHKINADSIFNAGLQIGIEYARGLFAIATAPRDTTIIFDGIGELFHRSIRLEGMEYYTLKPFPQKIIERTITDSIFVPTPSEQSWYDHWYWGVIGTGIVIVGANQLR